MKKRKASELDLEEQKFLTKIMTMGSGTNLPIVMSESELAKIIGIIYHDTNSSAELQEALPGMWEQINPNNDYYNVSETWFTTPFPMEPGQHIALLKLGREQIDDFNTYLRCLAELHKRRRKYAKILTAQPLPTMVQVSPRSLIEYGVTDPAALASWLTWRKFCYDLDNRAAQETGYLFEPILASAIGGEQKSASTKVVRRTNDNDKGRQVDCWKVLPDGSKLAYEFKLRVTIAASGQGRFSEEIQFAEDAQKSGSKPILVVLDPTMNPRLSDLQDAYINRGGNAYLGDDAWKHLEEQAGEVMANFIEKYVRKPIEEITKFEVTCETPQNSLLNLGLQLTGDTIKITLGDHSREIKREEDQSLKTENDSNN